MVWRRLRIAADTSLAALHFIFQNVQGWGDDHLGLRFPNGALYC